MNLLEFLKTIPTDQRGEFASRCGTTPGHLNNVAYRYKPCGPELAVNIERESGRLVTRPDLRPDDWDRIWPELAA